MLFKPLVMAALLVASCAVQAAGDAELAAIRSQIAEMKQAYEQRIAALEQRLDQAEAKAKADEARPAQQEVPAAATASAGSFNPEVSLILQGSYKNMKNLPQRTLTGFAPATNESLNGRGFSTDESELVLASNVDPYWRGMAVVAMADGRANIEEAWAQSLAIGHGVGLKIGRFRSGIGYLNEQHPHARDFADAPLMYQAMFGDAYTQDGVQMKWLAPIPVFLEFGGELGRGANFPGTDRNKNGAGGGALFAHIGDDLGIANSWRAGLSWLKTSASDRAANYVGSDGSAVSGALTGDSRTWLADFVWKWAPNGNPKYQNFKFQTEYFQRRESGDLNCSGGICGTTSASTYRTRQRGWYALGVYQFTPEWRAGLRYEKLDSGTRDFGSNAGNLLLDSYRPQKTSAMVDYSWSEFARVRLQYAQDESMPGVTDKQWTVQYIMSLGAHGAHKF